MRVAGEPRVVADGAVPDGLLDAFWAYERALGSDDVTELDRLFARGPHTLRGDASGLLVGHEQIAAFRSGRGGAPTRTVLDVHVRTITPDDALVVAVTALARGGRGRQSQLWHRGPDGWAVRAADVTVPAPRTDPRVWRVVGEPLVAGARTPAPHAGRGHGSLPGDVLLLAGETVAVKDLFAVAGHRVGAGNPAWLEDAGVEPAHAWAVDALLAAGADVVGIARTDELAYSLAGTNAHHGAPPNPAAPGRVPGGSTSGPATAVSLGQASIALGTDTGGSVRVPAAYQGLWGLRTTHGAVPRDGLVGLAPSFDTIGCLARTPEVLARATAVLLPAAGVPCPVTPVRPVRTAVAEAADPQELLGQVVVVPPLVAHADADVADAVLALADRLGWARSGVLADAPFARWREAFQTVQAWEAWREHGAWLTRRGLDVLGPDVRARLAHAATVTDDDARAARAVAADVRQAVRAAVGDRVLAFPAASSVAPPLLGGQAGHGAAAAAVDAARQRTMELTCLAGLAGLPALAVPLRTADGLPCGVSLVAGEGRDHDLLAIACALGTEVP